MIDFKKAGLLFFLCFGMSFFATAQTDEEQRIISAFMDGSVEIEAVQEFLDNGSDVNLSNTLGWTLLFMATRLDNLELVELLLNRGADANAFSTSWSFFHKGSGYIAVPVGTTPLMVASSNSLTVASHNHKVAFARLLLGAGADVNASNDDGQTALIYASTSAQTDLLRLLLDAGANVDDATVRSGTTPLTWAAMVGEVEPLRLLLDAGADVNTPTSHGVTPLSSAAANGKVEAVRLLLREGANNIGFGREEGQDALIQAIRSDHIPIVDTLLAIGADVNTPTSRGVTPLMHVDTADMVNTLITAGANVDDADIHGHTVLFFYIRYIRRLARSPRHLTSFQRTLFQRDPDRFQRDFEFALMMYQSRLSTLRALLTNGADPNKQDHWGCTVLAYVENDNRLDEDEKSQIMEIFREFGENVPSSNANCDPTRWH